MYITTSRKPSDSTRRLARVISNFIGVYENRGKKSIAELITRAEELGETRIMLLSESKGNPNSMAFISVGKEWEWVEPEIIFSLSGNELPKIRKLNKQLKYQGSEKYSNLFDFQEPDTDDVILVQMDDKYLSFEYGKLKVLLNINKLRRLVKTD